MENDTVLRRFNKIFPWYSGLSGDLLFWIAIDTLFLAVVKNFNSSQIVSLTSVSLVTCILLQMPLLKIINRIGNTNSVRLGSLLLLVSSLLLTFGQNYITIALGKVVYEIAFTFQNMVNAILKNNLELQNTCNNIYFLNTVLRTKVASPHYVLNYSLRGK